MPTNSTFNIVAQNPQSTVVSEYSFDTARESSYQSEGDLEKAFIRQLEAQAYEYLKITTEADLVSNLRLQIEKLNDYKFSDAEWKNFFANELSNPNQSIEEKTATIQEDHIKNLKCDNGSVKNIYLLKKDNMVPTTKVG